MSRINVKMGFTSLEQSSLSYWVCSCKRKRSSQVSKWSINSGYLTQKTRRRMREKNCASLNFLSILLCLSASNFPFRY